MKLTLEHGTNRDPAIVLDALAARVLEFDVVRQTDTWPDEVELLVEEDIEHERLRLLVVIVAASLCPDEILLRMRIIRAADQQDLLYGIPCDDIEPASAALQQDIDAYTDDADGFRSWFRSQWTGSDEEYARTEEELASAPLTAERMLDYLDPPMFRDWRPIQHYIEREASCSELVRAIQMASTSTQKWRLAYAFGRRGRSCRGAVPQLIRFLKDADRQVREEAADSLGQVVMSLRGHGLSGLRDDAGSALLAYVRAHPGDNLYFARTALGATGYGPARSYLERNVQHGDGHAQESARRALESLDRTNRLSVDELRKPARSR